MAILKWTGIDSFLRRDAEKAVAVLIYGPDGGTVRERARQMVISIAGSIDDPFAVVRLDDAVLAADPARLPDEAQALSFGGGKTIYRGKTFSNVSYDDVGQSFADLQAKTNAVERGAHEIALDIRTRLAAHFASAR